MINLYNKIEKAPNFSWFEFIRSDTAMRLNINNIPQENYIWNNIKNLAKNIQLIRNEFGPIRILSGFRCQLLNTAIGSSKISNHCYGLAADIEPFNSKIKLIDILNWICDNMDFKELIAEYFPMGWVHLAVQKDNNNKILKLKDKKHNYSRVDIDYINKIYI